MSRRLLLTLTLAAATASAHAQAPPVEVPAARSDNGGVTPSLGDAGALPPATNEGDAPGSSTQQAADQLGTQASADIGVPEDLDELSETEMAALGLTQHAQGVDTSLHFSGFADFTSFHPIKQRGASSIALAKRQSFYVGNVNVYLGKALSENFRTLAEVRFTYLPNGGLDPGSLSFSYLSTQITDYADNSKNVRWGGIILQRVYLEWSLHRLLAVRGGQFLTPIGIWNVDHGSPVYIPVMRPYAINSNYFPERQTGLEAFGRWDATNRTTFGYHLTVSNGGGAVSEYRDLDKNKAIGARLYLEYQGAGLLRVGSSGLYGRETYGVPKVTISAANLDVSDSITTQFDALVLAADVTYTFRGLRLQAEWVSQQRRYTDAGRVARTQLFATVSRGFSANTLMWAGYVLAAYSLPWYALTPYVVAQISRELTPFTLPDYKLRAVQVQAGVSVRPIDPVVFKAEFLRGMFQDKGPLLSYPIMYVQFQAAWAF